MQTHIQQKPPKIIPRSLDGLAVSETVYWEKYYENPENIYEWNNGILEEKPVSDHLNVLMYLWFLEVLRYFLKTHPMAKIAALEMGFGFTSTNKTAIRRPDLGVVLNNNAVSLEPDDCTYHGIFDLCVEALSKSTQKVIEHDTVTKKAEYANAGVTEYYILDAGPDMGFYRCNARGIYMPIRMTKDGIIKSKVLPGFQFRKDDLYNQLTVEQMIEDPVYKSFVLPGYSEAKRRAKQAEQQFLEEAIRANQAEQRADWAEQRAVWAEQQAEKEAKEAKQAKQQAEKEVLRADWAQQQVTQKAMEVEQAKQQAKAAEAEIARLKSLLANKK